MNSICIITLSALMYASQPASIPYFEGQSVFSRNCGLHAVNNLLGIRYYTKDSLDGICEALDPKKIRN